jgi:hypothetical protein
MLFTILDHEFGHVDSMRTPGLTLGLVGVGFVLGLELEVLVCRAEEHLTEIEH